MLSVFQKLFSLVLAFFSLLFSGGLFRGEGTYLRFESDAAFEPIAAQALAVTPEEQETCRRWYEENILFAGLNGKAPAYSFTADGIPLASELADWTFTVGEESEPGALRRGGKTAQITLKNEKRALAATVEATIYEAHGTCEWTVSIENTGKKPSAVLSAFYAAKCALPLGKAEIYCSRGSENNAADFTMLRARFPEMPLRINAGTDGRSTRLFLPYFNLSGERCGAVLGVGWTGIWEASFCGAANGMRIGVRQKNLTARLLPGEAIRSPLVSLCFYGGGNPVKGFNRFRTWVKDCVYPANAPTVQNNMDVLFVSATRTAAEILYDLEQYDKSRFAYLDNLWMDAGWYKGCEENWADGVGNWTTAPERFPKGVKEISDYAAGYDTGLVLWYEPERLSCRSDLYRVGRQHDEWLVDLAPEDAHNDRVMWNLANDDARRYLSDFIAATLKDNGVTVYRQDFNYAPGEYWKYADRHYYGGRTGIAENHYITGLYAYLDALFAAVPGLQMDNCASGGQRLDLEMTRRSVPMWRSDYNCDQSRPDLLNATQAHTYGLSFWLPVSGTFINFDSVYGLRSSILPILQVPMSADAAVLSAYRTEREEQLKNFFPVAFGGVKEDGVTAMQYGDETAGYLVVYHHKNAPTEELRLRFSGLQEDGSYRVWDIDTQEITVRGGAALMRDGFVLDPGSGETAKILRYSRDAG